MIYHIRFLLLICLLASPFLSRTQITYIASASTPADNGTSGVSPTAVTPPAMVAGDLVLLFAYGRTTTLTMAISVTGGQVWNDEAVISNTNISARLFWCRFNGTWAANPSVSFSNVATATVIMHVFRPTKPSLRWAVEANRVETDFAAPTTPFTVTIPGVTTRVPSSVSIAAWFTPDDNSWATLTGTGWTVLGTAQYRNLNGTDGSGSFAYNIKTTAGATNDVSKNQTANGGDLGTTMIITFFEMAHGMSALLLN